MASLEEGMIWIMMMAKKDRIGERTKVFDNVFNAGKELKINYICIRDCIDGKYEQAYGYKWFKIEDGGLN